MSRVEVREMVANKGRCLFASENIKAGDVIFEEKPLISCQFLWNEFYGYRACEFCLKPLESAEENARRLTNSATLVLPFPECCSTDKTRHTSCPLGCGKVYCSENCQQEAWEKYHKSLCLSSPDVSQEAKCGLNQAIETWKHCHYPPETASITLLSKMIANVKQAKDKQQIINLYSKFCHKTVNEEEHFAHKLMGEKFEGQLNTLRELMTAAHFDPEIHSWFTVEGFRSLIALIGTNGQGIGTSALSSWVRNCDDLEVSESKRQELDSFIDKLYDDIDKEAGVFLNNEGSGLYALQACCNHSCLPSAETTFPRNDFTLVMQALKDIKKGEEICVSYLDVCGLERSRHSRRKQLQENYLFTCSCGKCESEKEQPDVTSSEDEDEDEEDDMQCDF